MSRRHLVRPYAEPRGDAEGVCAAPKRPGEACPVGGVGFNGFDRGCLTGLCYAPTGEPAGTCVEVADGQSCLTVRLEVDGGTEESSPDCGPGYDCDWRSDTCRPLVRCRR